MSQMQARRAELYEHVAAMAKQAVLEMGLDEATAEHAAAAVADGLAEDFAGQIISFPIKAAYPLSQRERDILRDRDQGATLADLCRRYHMTERGLRRLINRLKARPAPPDQPSLF